MKTKKTTTKKRAVRKAKNASSDQMLAKALATLGEKIDQRMDELSNAQRELKALREEHDKVIGEANKLRAAFYDLRDNGIRFDLNPTTILGPGTTSDGTPNGTYTFEQVRKFSAEVHSFYQEYLKRIDEAQRKFARIALSEVTPEQAYGFIGGTVAQVVRSSDNMDEPPHNVYERIQRALSAKEPRHFLTGHDAIDLWREVREAKGNIECPENDDELYKLIKPFLRRESRDGFRSGEDEPRG